MNEQTSKRTNSGEDANKDNDRDRGKSLSTKEVILLGTAGGFIAAILSHPDLFSLLKDPSLANLGEFGWLNFGVTSVICMLLGAIWTYVHIPEYDRRKALQIGLVAPAIISSTIYANVPDEEVDISSDETASIHQYQNSNTLYDEYEPKVASIGINTPYRTPTKIHLQMDLQNTILAKGEEEEGKRKKRKRKSWWERIFS